MRLNNYIENNTEYPSFEGWLYLLQNNRVDEVSDKTFEVMERLGKRMGFKIKKSNTLFDYLRQAGGKFETILRLASLYLLTDISAGEERKEIAQDIKNEIKKVNKKDLMAFFMQLDKALLGFTSIPRHVLMSILGIEITTYNRWMDDVDYIDKETRHIKKVLKRMPGTDKELELIKKFEKSFHEMIKS